MPELAPLWHFDFIGWDHGLSTFVPQPFCPAGCKYPFGPPRLSSPRCCAAPSPPRPIPGQFSWRIDPRGRCVATADDETTGLKKEGAPLSACTLLKRFRSGCLTRERFRIIGGSRRLVAVLMTRFYPPGLLSDCFGILLFRTTTIC